MRGRIKRKSKKGIYNGASQIALESLEEEAKRKEIIRFSLEKDEVGVYELP